ncbi:hypothetical protein R3X27_20330 [Tropicimonas sp. TH_r6]|uniref:hypothetical protein n=1 Tax=Tropicimonas sp. TH_r6 TaxID=3082085 RepID=UPI002952A016|nr:hypothetical protein [Tropicimonas sp. TH_r6]MDV7145034.1 hypothetical protein [Tropicimonas sp. TH_r6]
MTTPVSPTANEFSRDLLDTGMEATMLAVEANMVVAYRTGAFCGFRPMSGAEIHRMFAEKPPAFAAAAMAAGLTAFGGQRPDQVIAAALHPLRTETNRNLRRLGGEA